MTFTLSGRFSVASFSRYAWERATCLSVRLEKSEITPDRALFSKQGHPDLLGMLEMACLVGPADCIVTELRAYA